jgi:methyl-accepting chemotaxis protein
LFRQRFKVLERGLNEMHRIFQLTIKKKLTCSFAFILLLPSLFIGYFSFQSAKDKISQEMVQTSNQSANLLNHLIDRTIVPKLKDADNLSSKINGQMVQGKESPLIRVKFDQYAGLHPEVLTTYVGTESGLMIMSPVQKLPSGFDPRKRPWYQQAMNQKGKAVITDLFVDAITGDMVVTIAKTLDDGSGVIGIDLNIKELAGISKEIKIGNQGYVMILDRNHKYIVHPTKKAGTDATGDWVDAMYKQEAGNIQGTFDGDKKEMSFITNPTTGWKLACNIVESEIQKEASPILYRTFDVVLVAIIISSLLAYTIVRSITKPLNLLIKASERISQGDLTVPLNLHQRDELGQLGNRFNQMRDTLHVLLTDINGKSEILAASSEELNASVEQTSKATEQIATAIQQIAAGSENQVQGVQESSKTINHMSTGVKQITLNAQNVLDRSTLASEKTKQGNQAIQTAIMQMDHVRETVYGLAEVIKGLEERSKEIEQITNVITDISSQTNLLALNAAIEAARAGEHGRGFAVVADEVRKLAEQSNESAKQISSLISMTQVETNKAVQSMTTTTKDVMEGIRLVNTAGISFEQIQNVIDKVVSQIQEVSSAIGQMAFGTVQVVESINMIEKVSEETASGTQNISVATEEQLASMEEISASASALSIMAEELQMLIRKFKV